MFGRRGIQQKLFYSQLIATILVALTLFFFYAHVTELTLVTMFVGILFFFLLTSLLSFRTTLELKEDLQKLSQIMRNPEAHFEESFHTEECEELHGRLSIEAKKTQDKLKNILSQKRELDAVLESMVEGVIAIDTQERILNMNRAALTLLGLKELPGERASVQEVIRNSEFQKIAKQILLSNHSMQDDIVFYTDKGEIILQISAVPLQNVDGNTMGALFVFHDITKLRKLESMRSDFVANVSHELKTPITSIKGFVETLLDGAIDQPADARRFIEIVGKQSERLSDIIDDLLSLSRLEQSGDDEQISRERIYVRSVIESAILSCQHEAKEKAIAIEHTCHPELTITANSHLLEQALVNLISNGLKYSETGNRVLIEAVPAGDELLLRVQDFGSGIPRIHLPRLFERFYRVDKARSRKLGGTGLGLAIVKHIAQAHKGYIHVESTVGEGSVFTLHIPNQQSSPETKNAT